jgi:hypothetical protein
VVAFRKREKKDITNPTIVSYNDSAVIFFILFTTHKLQSPRSEKKFKRPQRSQGYLWINYGLKKSNFATKIQISRQKSNFAPKSHLIRLIRVVQELRDGCLEP